MKHAAPIVVALLLIRGNPANADALAPAPPPPVITLDAALALSDERSPRANAERAEVDVVAAERVTAKALPNPTLNYGGVQLLGGENTGSETAHQITIEQPLLLFGQRGARQRLAELNTRVAQAHVATSRADRRLQVRAAFTELLVRQKALTVLQESLKDLERVQEVVHGRAAAGDRSQYDLARVRARVQQMELDVMNARTDVADASGKLAAILGFPGWIPQADGTLDPEVIPTDVDVLWDAAQKQRASLAELRQREVAAAGGLALAQRERWPIPTLTAGSQLTKNQNSESAVFGVSLPIPLLDRNQGAVAKASAEVAAEHRALDAELAETRAELERATTVLRQHRESLAALQGEVDQQQPTLRRMAEQAYREGNGGILELLDAFTLLRDMRLLQLKQLEAVKIAEANVVAVAGLDTAPSEGSTGLGM